MSNEVTAYPSNQLARIGLDALPAIVTAAGQQASRRFIEFFTATIRNKNTRLAYARAVCQFFDWCGSRGFKTLTQIEPVKDTLVVINPRRVAVILDKQAHKGAVIPVEFIDQVIQGRMKSKLQAWLVSPVTPYYIMHIAGLWHSAKLTGLRSLKLTHR